MKKWAAMAGMLLVAAALLEPWLEDQSGARQNAVVAVAQILAAAAALLTVIVAAVSATRSAEASHAAQVTAARATEALARSYLPHTMGIEIRPSSLDPELADQESTLVLTSELREVKDPRAYMGDESHVGVELEMGEGQQRAWRVPERSEGDRTFRVVFRDGGGLLEFFVKTTTSTAAVSQEVFVGIGLWPDPAVR